MSLRAFHLFFIALSVILAALVASWATDQYSAQQNWAYLVAAGAALVFGTGLAVYGTMFQRKTRNL
jgi:FlaG/FlaF family flagellin (archaellin)